MKHLSRKKITTISTLPVSCTIHEYEVFYFGFMFISSKVHFLMDRYTCLSPSTKMFHDQAFVLRSQSCVSLSENYSIFGTGKTKLLKMLQHFNLLSA